MARLGCQTLCLLLLLTGCQSTQDRVWLDQALAHRELEQGNAGRAIELLDQCKSRRPDYAPTYLSLAAAWAQRGDHNKFRENIEIYRKLNPTHDVAELYLAEADFKEKQWDPARRHFEQFLTVTDRQFDSKTLARRAHAYARLSEIAEQTDQPADAHLATAREEISKAWGAALGPNEPAMDRVRNCLVRALEELQAARALSQTKPPIDREIDLVRSMLESAETGHLADLAHLLSARSEVETPALALSPSTHSVDPEATRNVDPEATQSVEAASEQR